MKFYVDEMPKSCSDNDCPFNYDNIGCRAISYSMTEREYDIFSYTSEYDEVQKYLEHRGEYKKRYPKCPLIVLNKEQCNGKNNNT